MANGSTAVETEGLPALMRARETAALCGVSIFTLYEWSRSGLIPTRRIGRSVRFPRAEVLRWLSGRPAS